MTHFFLGGFFGAVFLTWLLVGRVRQYALNANILDRPNERSSHVMPTPRGGGLAVVAGISVAMTVLWLCEVISFDLLLVASPTLAVAIIGWVDDRRGLSVRIRLVVQLISALAVVLMLGSVHQISLSTQIAFLFFLVWMINLYNFMDGSDGILGLHVTTLALSFVVILAWRSFSQLSPVYLVIAGCTIGFLIWNWHPAKIFMGDVGSAALGFLLAALALYSVVGGEISPALVMILHAAFIGDATWTLVNRAVRGRRIFQAHRSHFYQKLLRIGWSHSSVARLFGSFNLLWLLPIAGMNSVGWLDDFPAIALAYMPIAIGCIELKAGIEPS